MSHTLEVQLNTLCFTTKHMYHVPYNYGVLIRVQVPSNFIHHKTSLHVFNILTLPNDRCCEYVPRLTMCCHPICCTKIL